MKFLNVVDLWAPPSARWHAIPEPKETVVTANNQPVAILSAFDETQMANALDAFRRDHAMEALVAIQYRAVQIGIHIMTPAEIAAEIETARIETNR